MEDGGASEGGGRELGERIKVYVASMPVKRAPTVEELRRLTGLRHSRAAQHGMSACLSQNQREGDEDEEEEDDELYRL